jgi:glycosyltransferase involved in cell wall biosynthesis
MSKKPFFSIIIPTYNREKELIRSITSVQHQTFPDWELIVIDDGSIDGTKDLISNLQSKDQRIRYFERPTTSAKGASTCRNIGIKQAHGILVAFLDSDDEWLGSKLESDLNYFNENSNTTAAYSGSLLDNGKNRTKMSSRHLHEGESYEDLVFSGDNFAQTSTMVVRRLVLESIEFDQKTFPHDDIDFFIKVGNAFGWDAMNHCLSILHWPSKKTITGFSSMIVFFERYKSKACDPNNLARYLTWCWVSAARFSKEYKSYYARELWQLFRRVRLKYKVFILLREPLFFLWKTQRWIRQK